VVTLAVILLRFHQNLARAELYAKATAFAALFKDMEDAMRHPDLRQVQWLSPILHRARDNLPK